jgi:hypothetical protein
MLSTGIESVRGEGDWWYFVVRPNGRTSRRCFGSPFRAAEYAEKAYRVKTWTELKERGFTIQALVPRRPDD